MLLLTLFENQTTNATSPPSDLIIATGAVAVSGTFDGATVTMEASLDGGTTFIAATAITEAAIKAYKCTKQTKMRAVITGAGLSTSLTVLMHPED